MENPRQKPPQFTLRDLMTAVALVAAYLALGQIVDLEWIVLATGGVVGAGALSSQGVRAGIFGALAGILSCGLIVGVIHSLRELRWLQR